MSTEIATVDGEIVEQRAPMTLFGTDDPTAVVERASTVATALASVITERELFARIGGKKHVQVEGWTLLGSMLGVFAEIEWSRPLDNGWEARAVARTLSGNVVGAAEAMCTVNEGRWKNADTYAVRSMAQTRAVSKALRMPLGFIMHLAGYSATPAEEVPEDQPESGRGPARAASTPNGPTQAPRTKGEAMDQYAAALRDEGLTFAQGNDIWKRHGLDRASASVEDIMRIISDIRGLETPGPTATAHAEASATDTPTSEDSPARAGSDAATAATEDDAVPPSPSSAAPAPTLDQIEAATGGEIIWPKPGTDEYKALPSGADRAKARAYWEKQKAVEPEQESLAEALGAPVA